LMTGLLSVAYSTILTGLPWFSGFV